MHLVDEDSTRRTLNYVHFMGAHEKESKREGGEKERVKQKDKGLLCHQTTAVIHDKASFIGKLITAAD